MVNYHHLTLPIPYCVDCVADVVVVVVVVAAADGFDDAADNDNCDRPH